MALFKSDDRGFLVGELVDTSREMLAAQHQSLNIWRGVRSDVAAIARAMGVAGRAGRTVPAVVKRSSRSAPSATPSTGLGGVGQVVTPVGRGGARTSPTTVAASRPQARTEVRPTVVVQPRGANGRFQRGEGKGDDGGKNASGGMLKDAAGRLSRAAGAIGAAAGSMENVDATVAAGKEIADVVAPLGRGLFGLFGRTAERKKERWYQRFWKALTSPVFGKRSDQPAAAAGPGILQTMLGGMFGGVGGLLSKMPSLLMTVLSRIFLPLVAVWGAWNLGQWIGEKINKWLTDSGVMEKVFDAFDAIGEAFDSAWNAVSGAVDTIVKTVSDTWTTITDTVKKAIDGLLDIPKKVGEFFAGLDGAIRKIPIIGDAYGKAVDALKEAAADMKRGYTEGESGKPDGKPASAAQAVGRDVGQVVRGAKDVGTQAKAGYDTARGRETDAPAPDSALQRVARGAGGAAGTAAGWVLGKTSERFESGGRGVGTVSNGKGDRGGASYGTYQLASKTGTLDKFLQASSYGKQFAGLTPGTAEFNAKWKEIAKDDPAFGDAQHDFIKGTHYDPALAGLKAAGIDLSGHGAAVQDALWSTSVQFGAGSVKRNDGAIGLFRKALAGKDANKMTGAEIVAAVQDYKARNNETLFARSSAEVRAGTLRRATAEKAALLKLDGTQTAASTVPRVPAANVPPATPPTVPPTPADEVPNRLNSSGGSGPVQVSINDRTTQDVRNRRIANLASGGISPA
ncbi:hypothetical protein [Xenophilus azovorans]|uniref:VgrG-related protein n=1 Tax=Xenophilus azovorans TaxID=151755 RepID=UPI00068F42A5|nr:hypothetical protein [Xenophilus azovorans]